MLCETSKEDNGNPILEVVELLNNLLAEQLVQHSGLSASIEQQATLEIEVDTSELSAAKLFQRIYYTKIYHSEIPIMTGDIFDISSE
ncbi:MAG: hypothetical protein LH606_13635 [Cytophagaceae bacterium]|nr:hypothetical protein [Cytophagaceae bacterium]